MFNRLADWVSDRWSSAWWFTLCCAFVIVWLVYGAARGLWSNDTWHLALNSPTTGLTFLGLFLLHNTQHRFEKAVNQRLQELIDKLPATEDPVDDEGQRVSSDDGVDTV